jgi:hypothetical protein
VRVSDEDTGTKTRRGSDLLRGLEPYRLRPAVPCSSIANCSHDQERNHEHWFTRAIRRKVYPCSILWRAGSGFHRIRRAALCPDRAVLRQLAAHERPAQSGCRFGGAAEQGRVRRHRAASPPARPADLPPDVIEPLYLGSGSPRSAKPSANGGLPRTLSAQHTARRVHPLPYSYPSTSLVIESHPGPLLKPALTLISVGFHGAAERGLFCGMEWSVVGT